jgi:hypothetical protein
VRKALAVVVAAVLIAGLIGAPASAQRKRQRPKPVDTTLYLHGEDQFGEMSLLDQWLDNALHHMGPDEPEGTSSKSQFVTNYVVGPNTRCDGNGLLGTVWRGELTGRVRRNVKLTLHTAATPGASLRIGLFPDGAGTCAPMGEEGPPAAALEDVAIEPGQNETEVVFRRVNFRAIRTLVLQIGSVPQSPGQVRIFYDSETHPSALEFKCIPPRRGRSCTP